MSNIQLHAGSLDLSFSGETGALIGLYAPDTDWPILGRPELGLSWRLTVPLDEEHRNNNVFGEKQKLASSDVSGNEITFVWDNVMSEAGVCIDARITLSVRAEDGQAVYYMNIQNRSPYCIENVYCPYLGDVRYPAGAPWFRSFSYSYASCQEFSIWPEFTNLTGYYGTDYPTIISGPAAGAPCTPYFLMRSENQGLYAGIKSPSEESVAWMMELRPGYESSINALAPDTAGIGGKAVQTLFAALHTPFLQPGESRSLTPVALEAFKGGWYKGADIYIKWRNTWMKPAAAPAWAREPHAWQQLHINSPEDELRMRFSDLPKAAETCRKYGVKAIQLVGWNDGGQDQGNPLHDPDPRLGTFDELKEAISKCHEIGVKIILFSKFTWADRGAKWFRNGLKELAVKDPYGDYYMHPGYQYQTGTQLLDINTKRLVPMCFLSEEYLKICEGEFQKVVNLGADGMLYDECQHHGPSLLCFDESHGHRYGAPVYKNDRELIKRFRKTPGIPEDFLMSGEACYDWEMEVYQLAYHRSNNKRHVPLGRYMLPYSQFMTAVTGFNDRNMINQCLMCRYVISYEPYNFKGCLDDFPLTMAYGVKMDALRSEYRKWFWDGEFRDTCGAEVTALDGRHHNPYAVFKADDGSLGLVICNYEDSSETVSAKTDTGGKFIKYRTVDENDWKYCGTGIIIPPRSAVIVLE